MQRSGKYNMFLGILVLITALTISGVAIYYSIAGLAAIFAAAVVPIIVMGVALEVGKLVTAVWLHRYWKKAVWWLKTYLTIAVVVLMLITSMGIFGFLSKAHIEQTAQSTDNLAKIETIQNEIDRNLVIIGRSENKIRELDNSQSNSDTTIQDQIDIEQERIDTAYDRVQPLIEEQNKNLDDQIKLFGLDKVDAKISALEQAMNINTKDKDAVRVLQSMVGARPDGAYGSGTARKVEEYRNSLNVERDSILTQIQQARKVTNEEIARIRQGAEAQIAESNKLINRLREKLGKQDNAEEVQKAIDEQNERVRTASSEIENLTEKKIALESEYRKLEAEVGPIKYIAEFVYGEQADKDLLEQAVRWVIITIIFVFDPLAVLLLIASQYTFDFTRRKDDSGERLRQEYERLRAEKIANNSYTVDPQTTEEKVDEEENDQGEPEQSQQENAETLLERENQESVEREERDDSPLVEIEQEEKQRIADSYIEKKDQESSEDSQRLTEEEFDALDHNDEWKSAKAQWKADNPNDTLKQYKDYYLDGKIDDLPWEKYLPEGADLKKKRSYIMKVDNQQVRKEAED
jgi:hypothetical protein|tara:strand:- start:1998 stop:3728 length:1731 start_codon:yes stop_codon:yes gene_type:complete